eukprot:Nitzschia sp. Nitz4//scaffold313_size41840//20342//21536//NITZ4_007435-RA/size41840-processed-gene-0.10-mRNA-1//-1//CDS//3329547427//1076//frame0
MKWPSLVFQPLTREVLDPVVCFRNFDGDHVTLFLSTLELPQGISMEKMETSTDTDETLSRSSSSLSSSFPLPHVSESDIVVMVLTRRTGWDRRQTIRETWASNRTDVYFVVGQGCNVPVSLRDRDEGNNELCQVAPIVLPDNYMSMTRQQMDLEHNVTQRLLEEQTRYQDLLMMEEVDMYRTLPKKLKFAYRFVHEHLPTVDWVVKVDDDFYVRVDGFQGLLRRPLQGRQYNPRNESVIVGGSIRTAHKAHIKGKWKEVPQWTQGEVYPPFPIGSRGHAVTRPIVKYVAQNYLALFDYQGEDVSLGIWLDQPSAPEPKEFVELSEEMRNDANCEKATDSYVIGHDLTLLYIENCWLRDIAIRKRQQQSE